MSKSGLSEIFIHTDTDFTELTPTVTSGNSEFLSGSRLMSTLIHVLYRCAKPVEKTSNDFIPHLSCTACVFLLTKAFLFVYRRLMARVWARIANVSNMDVKFLAMLDPNCRLNFPKSGKLVALLFLPDALHLSFFILLSILFIITNCGLQSHAGLEGLQLFINCGS